MNNPITIPPALALIRNQLIDIAFGRRVNLPEHGDIEKLAEWIDKNAILNTIKTENSSL